MQCTTPSVSDEPAPIPAVEINIEVRHHGSTMKFFSRRSYRFDRNDGDILKRLGWTLAQGPSRKYAYLSPPEGYGYVPKDIPIRLPVPEEAALAAFAEACHAKGMPARGVLHGWHWSYTPQRTYTDEDGTRTYPAVFHIGQGLGLVWSWRRRWETP
jgi:hypothetical protein